MTDTIRWGILSTGNIARQFAQGLAVLPDHEIVAVGSRRQSSADAFGDEFGVPHRHASYEALAADPDVDVIYIGTPHVYHKDNALLCIDAGKHVLCEKPFTINASEAREVIDAARAKGVFLMEAMWTRFVPAMQRVRELIDAGEIGEVRAVHADFGFRATFDPQPRLFNPALGGGALLDVGVYPVSLAMWFLGTPPEIVSTAHLGETGVDDHAGMLFRYPQGEIAALTCAITVRTPMVASIAGAEGRIVIHADWWRAARFTLHRADGRTQDFDLPPQGNGYEYEAAEVGHCLRAGQTESAVMPLADTLAIMETLDAIRAQWGLRYPGEA